MQTALHRQFDRSVSDQEPSSDSHLVNPTDLLLALLAACAASSAGAAGRI